MKKRMLIFIFFMVSLFCKSEPLKINLIGSIQYPHGWGVDFVKKENYIFQSKSESNLKVAVIDVSDPKDMKVVKEIEGGKNAVRNLSIWEEGNILVCNAYQRIVPIDISNPKSPVELKEYEWQPDEWKDKVPPFYRFEFKNNFLILACAELKKGLRIYKIEKPFIPHLVATLNLDVFKDEDYSSFVSKNWYPNEMSIHNDLLFVSFGNILCVVNIANPENPSLISVYKCKENIESFTIIENKLIMCLSGRKNSYEIKEGEEKIVILDISSLPKIKKISNFKDIEIPERIYGINNKLLVVGLEKISQNAYPTIPKSLLELYKYSPVIYLCDIQKDEIKVLSKFCLPLRILPYKDSICRKIIFEKGYIFIADHNFGIRCFTIKNNSLVEIGNVRTITQETRSMVIAGSYIYIGGENSLIPVDISNIKNPKMKRENIIFFPGNVVETYQHNLSYPYIYYVSKDLKNIIVLNIENKEKPFIKSFIPLPEDVDWYYVHEIDKYIYVIGNGKEKTINILVCSIEKEGRDLKYLKRIDLKPIIKENQNIQTIIQRGICLEDKNLYLLGYCIIGNDSGLKEEGSVFFTFDISKPSDPKLIGNSFLKDVIPGGSLAYGGPGVYKKVLYFFTHPQEIEKRKISYLCAVDMSDPNNVKLISKKILEDPSYYLKIVGYSGRVLILSPYPYLILQEYGYGMRLIDITDPTNPILVWKEEPVPSKFEEFYNVYGWGRLFFYLNRYILNNRLDHLDIFEISR